MFHDIAEPSVRVGSRKAYVVPVSIAAHVVIVGLAFVVPLAFPGVLPSPAVVIEAVWFPRDIPLPPEPVRPTSPTTIRPRAPETRGPSNPAAAPVQAPDAIGKEPERSADTVPREPGDVNGLDDARGVIAEEPTPAPPTPAPVPEAPRRIGGDIRPPAKLKHVNPDYPAIALATHTSGVVIVETTIGVDGRVVDARVLRSVPLLDDAALVAVRQWEFTSTLLNGTPVPVVMTVTVNFSLK